METLFEQRIQKLSRPLEPLPAEQTPVLTPMTGIRAVIFDIYGTCVISGSGDIGLSAAERKSSALSEALREQGVDMDAELAEPAMARFYELIHHRHAELKGQGIAYPEVRILDIWEHWRREAGVQINVPQLAIDVECRLNPVWPMPGLIHTLEQIQARELSLGIVSNAQVFTPSIFPALTGHPLADLGFPARHAVWSWQLQEAKPSVRLYHEVLERLKLPATACLYVGNDMRNDIAPAAAVGMRTALFAGDARSLRLREGDPLVGDTRPDLVLTALTQLPPCLSG